MYVCVCVHFNFLYLPRSIGGPASLHSFCMPFPVPFSHSLFACHVAILHIFVMRLLLSFYFIFICVFVFAIAVCVCFLFGFFSFCFPFLCGTPFLQSGRVKSKESVGRVERDNREGARVRTLSMEIKMFINLLSSSNCSSIPTVSS